MIETHRPSPVIRPLKAKGTLQPIDPETREEMRKLDDEIHLLTYGGQRRQDPEISPVRLVDIIPATRHEVFRPPRHKPEPDA